MDDLLIYLSEWLALCARACVRACVRAVNDLILSGLVGLWPGPDGKLTVNPLIPPGALPWWSADGIAMHGKIVSVQFDLDGTHYQKGKGLKVFVDGKLVKQSPVMAKLELQLL